MVDPSREAPTPRDHVFSNFDPSYDTYLENNGLDHTEVLHYMAAQPFRDHIFSNSDPSHDSHLGKKWGTPLYGSSLWNTYNVTPALSIHRVALVIGL